MPSARSATWPPGVSATSPIHGRPRAEGAQISRRPMPARPAPKTRAAVRGSMGAGRLRGRRRVVAGRLHRDDAAAAAGLELDDARGARVQRVVLAHADAVAGLEAR